MTSIAAQSLGFFRDQWASRFVDSCVIKELTDPDQGFDPETGVLAPSYTTIYSGPCLIRPEARAAAEYGEQTASRATYEVVIPHDESGPKPGHLVDLTSTRDAYLNGKTVTIRGIRADTYNTSRHLDCEENQSD